MHKRVQRFVLPYAAYVSWSLLSFFVLAKEEEIDKDVQKQIWICVLDLDAGTSKRLFSLPDLEKAGSVAVTADESKVAFDGCFRGQTNLADTHVFVGNTDGSEIHDLGLGALPSWSPKGNRLVVSRYHARGVWLIDHDGENELSIDEEGWGGRWSPDGLSILYMRFFDRGPDFVTYDVIENLARPFFGAKGHPYSRLFFNTEWTRDGNRIVFKANRDDGSSEISSVSVEEPSDIQVHWLRNTYANIGLYGDDKIIVPYRSQEHGTVQLHWFPIEKDGPAAETSGQHLPGQYTHRNSYGAAMSLDGKRVYYASVPQVEQP